MTGVVLTLVNRPPSRSMRQSVMFSLKRLPTAIYTELDC